MAAPKGHLPYAGCEKGGLLGYLGKPDDAYTDEELIKLGQELVTWFFENPMETVIQDFFTYRGIHKNVVQYLIKKYPVFHNYYRLAKEIQESRMLKFPFWKKADGPHARFILANNHEGYKQIDSNKALSAESALIVGAFISDRIKEIDKLKENA